MKTKTFNYKKGDSFGMDDEIIFYIANLLCNNLDKCFVIILIKTKK